MASSRFRLVPSAARQHADAALADRQEAAVRAAVAKALGGSIAGPRRPVPGALTLQAWLANPVSDTLRHLWLDREGSGYASVMLLRGIDDAAAIPGSPRPCARCPARSGSIASRISRRCCTTTAC
jgi:predicted exporter